MLPEAMGAACKSLDIHITEYLENIMEKNHRTTGDWPATCLTGEKQYRSSTNKPCRGVGENLSGSFCAIQVDIEPSPAIIKYMKEFMLIPFLKPKWIERGYI